MFKEERLLTSEEINYILQSSELYTKFREEDLENIILMPSNNWLDVQYISPKHKLLFFKGNSDTGNEHILKRHVFYQSSQYWKNDGKPDNPSQFRRNIIPFGDFRIIADQLYEQHQKNKAKTVMGFDNFVGTVNLPDGHESKYKMVTYRNTRIVHTMYPTKPLGNLKHPDGFLWHRGAVHVRNKLIGKLQQFDVLIPYKDQTETLRYSIDIRFYNKKQQVYVLAHKHDTNQIGTSEVLFERDVDFPEQPDVLRSVFEYMEMFEFEKYILGLHNYLNRNQ